MSEMLKFDHRSKSSVMEFLESLDTADAILENSSVIIASEMSLKKDVLEHVLRHNNLSMDQLSEQKNKLTTAMHVAVDNNIPVSESTQQYMVDMVNLIDRRITETTDDRYQVMEDMLLLYENEIFDYEEPTYYPIRETGYGSLEESMDFIKKCDSSYMITPSGIRECIMMVVSDESPITDDNKALLLQSMQSKIDNVVIYESNDEKYRDYPIIQSIYYIRESLSHRYMDKPETVEKINTICDTIISKSQELIEENFNPNPFNLNELTPADVGCRTVMNTLADIMAAEDDKQIEECLLKFGRLNKICENSNMDIVEEQQGAFKKKMRAMARKSQRNAGKLRKKYEDGKDVAVAAKKTVDPMSKFIGGIVDKFHKADKNERRNIIIKGGVWPKILRWVKRGIGLVIAGSLGEIGAILSAITLLTFIATDVNADRKARNEIIRELETELEIVNEKIEDARGDSDKQNKYKLMRIRAKLQKDLDRISLGIK